MILTVNMLLGWRSDATPGTPLVERILWMSSSGTDVATFAIEHPAALPTMRRYDDIVAALATGQAQLLAHDPYARLSARAETGIPPAQRAVRDARWACIDALTQMPETTLYSPETRAQALRTLEQAWLAQHGVDPASEEASTMRKSFQKQVLKCLRLYWQRGQVKNALLPDFAKCGGKGKERRANPDSKRGRTPRLSAKHPDRSMVGVNITGQVREALLDGFQRFYVKAALPWREAYDQTMETFFSTIEIGDTGRYRYVLLPKEQRPTLGQFRYWGQKMQDLTTTLTKRKGQRAFDLHHRPLVGDTTSLALGPGSLVQEDATIADIYLVSELDRSRIIGRPVIYVLIDVFSRMIVGLAISLDGPSWQGVMSAIENMAIDKVAFCSEYGIPIAPEDWPCHFLPDAIIGDRGELFTHDATPLIASLGVKLLNTAPYRADWKGIIERFFRLLKNDTTITWMPGAVHERGRGEHDFRLDACLTLREFREIIIRCVLHYNTSRRLTTYTLDEFMIPDHVQPYPIELWQWGLSHRRGHLRTRDRQAIRLALLPRGEAQVTRGGIRFKGVPYTCERALREQWYVRASLAPWKVPVAYDPRNTGMLYLFLDQENDVEVATITDSRFANKDWLDVEDYLTLAKQATQEHRGAEEQALSDLRQNVRAIVTSAKASTAQKVTGMSKTERLEGIRANRKVERQRVHAQEAWTPHPSSSLLEPLEAEPFSYADWIRCTQTVGGADGQ